MALIRTLLITTFDQIDTDEEKNTMKELYESQGYRLIAETKLQETGLVKEWIFASPVSYGKFMDDRGTEQKHPKVTDLYNFKP